MRQVSQILRRTSHYGQEGADPSRKGTDRQKYQAAKMATRQSRLGRDPATVCCLSRSMLIYLGTPMVAAGLWKR